MCKISADKFNAVITLNIMPDSISSEESEFSSGSDGDEGDALEEICGSCHETFLSSQKGCSVVKQLCKPCHVEDKRKAVMANLDIVDISGGKENNNLYYLTL